MSEAATLEVPEKEILKVKVARILWTVENSDNLPDDISERNAAFQNERADYMSKAKLFMNMLDAHNLSLEM